LSVAFYMHDFAGGGAERMRLALFRALSVQGLSISAIVHARRGPLLDEIPEQIETIALGGSRTLSDIRPLAHFLREEKFDIVVSSLDHNNIALLIAKFLTRSRTRIIITQHNALSAEVRKGLKYRLVPFLYRLLWRQADGVVAVSDGVAGDLSRSAGICRKSIDVIYNPVVGDDFAERMKLPAPHVWLANPSCCTFVFAGRLTAQKDPQTLLRAFASVLQHRQARLIVLGEGELAAGLADLAASLEVSDAIHFAGFQLNPLPWIKHASALVLSSRYEGLGNVLIEALACGTPVIATDCPWGPAEILQGGGLGRLVPVGDIPALAEAMCNYADHPARACDRQARATDFSVEACVARHQALFSRVLARNQKLRPSAGRDMGPRSLFGLRLCTLDAQGCAARVLSERPVGGPALLVTPNINHLRLLRRSDFALAYRSAALVCADGFPLVIYARLRGLRLPGRVTGCDIFTHLVRHARFAEENVFLVVESTVTAAAARVWADQRGLSDRAKIVVAVERFGQHERAQRELAEAIRAHATTILVMGLGAPCSEIFVHRHRDLLPPCWALCIGQALRVETGLVARAPYPWRVLGLEWAWRMRQEPLRLGARYVRDVLWLPFAVLEDLLP
jgi:exopolysaccharide biosynthesis WecB/TagA/CpsF family protein